MGPVIYAFSWLLFAVVHSLLARPWLQKKFETYCGRYYRLLYNLLAALKLAVVFYIGSVWLSQSRFAMFDSAALFVATATLQVLGMVVMAVALLPYDIGRFAGITQVLTGERVSAVDNAQIREPLQRHWLNRWMRHPLYTGALLFLWGGAVHSLGLWTALWGSLYLLIGARFEERKLIRSYGEEYVQYQRDVPAFFPMPVFRR